MSRGKREQPRNAPKAVRWFGKFLAKLSESVLASLITSGIIWLFKKILNL